MIASEFVHQRQYRCQLVSLLHVKGSVLTNAVAGLIPLVGFKGVSKHAVAFMNILMVGGEVVFPVVGKASWRECSLLLSNGSVDGTHQP